jgi:uncharacterized membrane protein YphA (DoxX/SURF4 family)
MRPYLLSILRIALGFLFIQHGTEKLWGFPNGRVDHNFFTALHGFAGLLEFPGGLLLILGLFTRPLAFILCGEMAVAYFPLLGPSRILADQQRRRGSGDLLLYVPLAGYGRSGSVEPGLSAPEETQEGR